MKTKRNVFIALLCLTLVISTIAFFPLPAVYAQTTRLYVDPPSIIDITKLPPQTFSVSVNVENVINLYGFEFKVRWNTAILDLTGIVIPSFLNPPTFIARNETNESIGQYWLGLSSLGAPSGKDGSGTLVTLTFKVTGIGSSLLDLVDTKLGDPSAIPIPHDVEDGFFANIIAFSSLSVMPATVIDPGLEPSTSFNVSIFLENAIDLQSWELKLFYQNDILNITSIEFGPLLESGGSTTQLVKQLTDSYNTTHGIAWLNDTLTTGGVNGDGVIATITFHVVGTGESLLTLTDTNLLDVLGFLTDHDTANGYFNNVLFARIYVDPAEIFDPSLVPGSLVNVTIKMTDVTNLYRFKFNMTYNRNVLNCLGVLIFPYENETAFDTIVSWDNTIGELSVEVIYHPPAMPITSFTPFPVAKIFFQVASRGISILDLHDTDLRDSGDNPIVHQAEDGQIIIIIRDIAVTDIVLDKDQTYPGGVIDIQVTVRNEGNISESFTVDIMWGASLITTVPVVDLDPDTETTVGYSWDTTGLSPAYDKELKAEAPPLPYETDLADNIHVFGVVKIKILGDVNGDAVVDIFDLLVAAGVFGSSEGEPNFEEQADINFDGTIDIFDLIIVGTHFGETYP